MFTAQLCVQGAVKQADIIRAFGVSKSSVLRSVEKYRQQGIQGFYQPRRTRGASVMTPEVIRQARQLFEEGLPGTEVARQLDIAYGTLRKAIDQGRVQLPDRPANSGDSNEPEAAAADSNGAAPERSPCRTLVATGQASHPSPSDKSKRSHEDRAAGEQMGIACTRPIERVLASLGKLSGGAPTQFVPCRDVSYGGVLCALPALAENGLFRHLPTAFPTLTGYYTTLHVVLLLAYMALCRIRTVEQLQYESPGELGKLMGLDRVPEVRCLRNRLQQLSQDQAGQAPGIWAGLLSRDWLQQEPELAGTLYVDGHVRLYHGHLTQLPRRYVSRQRLCLRGTTDYWVNDALGQPFFSVERTIDHGILEAIENDIVPRLLHDVPGQPTQEELDADPYRSRFLMIFDRDRQSRSAKGKLTQRQARFAALTLQSEADETKTARWERQKADLREEIEQLEHEVHSLKEQMAGMSRHLAWDDFPADAKFERLAPSRKRLTDTVKLVAYRAETAMSGLLREELRRGDDSRSLLRDLFRSDADIIPDGAGRVLEVRLHTLANPRFNRAVQHLLCHLNATERAYPGTDFRLRYTLGVPENGVTENSS
ncbi:MAG: hypothetical protein RBS80_09745 [Thermoguttaceae bacterium]|jgi:hypothetical protein|nr:hypothetical protein [Thermoguttaceae bacterium]